MKTHRERVKYVIAAVITAFGYFLLSYNVVYLELAKENALVTTILNLVLILIILAEEKLELYVFRKLEKKTKKGIINKIVKALLYNVSFKTSLYCFYIGLLICYAIIIADPNFPLLGDMSDYFKSTYYGILVLIAADKFLDQVFKDVKIIEE